MSYLMPENYIIYSWREGKGVYTFLLDIGPKVNVIARLEFELASNDIAVQHISH